MEYQSEIVENLLRNYYSLQQHPDSTFSVYYIDLTYGLKELLARNNVLYLTIVDVFVNGMPIQEQADKMGVTTRQVSYRLNDALELLTNIMNGDANEG